MSTAQQLERKAAGATDVISVDLTDNLGATETVTSATSSATGITVGSVTVNAAEVEIGGSTVAIGKAAQFTVSGGSAGNDYIITLTYSTNAGRSNLELYLVLAVI